MSLRLGSHTIERLRARAPHSMRPWNQPTTIRRDRPRVRSHSAPRRSPVPPSALLLQFCGALAQQLAMSSVPNSAPVGVVHWPRERPAVARVPRDRGADRAAGVAGSDCTYSSRTASAAGPCRWPRSSWHNPRRARAVEAVGTVQRVDDGRTPPRTSFAPSGDVTVPIRQRRAGSRAAQRPPVRPNRAADSGDPPDHSKLTCSE